MASYIILAVTACLIYSVVKVSLGLKKNIAMAKESGLPYVVVPVQIYWRPWMIVHKPLVKLLRRLPVPIRPSWLPHVVLDQSWDNLSTQFDWCRKERVYLTVSPWGFLLWVGNADVINQITTRRVDYPKPVHIYTIIDLFGKNVVTTEGHAWRRHRKIIGPQFTEKNNHLVWNESILQADSMVKSWTGLDGNESKTVAELAHDCMRLSLHVISRAGFGVRLPWPGIESKSHGIQQGLESGHTMTYTDALEGLLRNLLIVIGLGPNILPYLPFKRAKVGYRSFLEWRKYMQEMVEEKKVEMSSGSSTEEGMDLMGQLIKSAGYDSDSKAEKGQAEQLSDEEILGNAFVFILAGHETTANTLHYSLLFLAIEIAEQRKLQKDVDSIFKGKKASEWNYDEHVPQLFGGLAGAIMNETLRLIPPVLNIPKCTHAWQTLNVNGKECKVPPSTSISLVATAVHRDPNYWPSGPALAKKEDNWHPFSDHDNDLNEFRPSRWLLAEGSKKSTTTMPLRDESKLDAEDLSVNTAADTSDQLYRPPKGAYIPFSEGFRSCIGRRFAQVEIMVVLAYIVSQWSIEFAVDEWATDEEVEKMTSEEKRALYKKARHTAREKLRTKMGTVITIQLRSGHYVPLRLVRRGKERFDFP